MKDWNSITVDRYYENINVDNKVGIGILDISRDIPNKFLQKRCFDMTYFYINRMIKMGMCSYVGFHKTVKEILELSIIGSIRKMSRKCKYNFKMKTLRGFLMTHTYQ